MIDLIGTTLGRYRIESLLGRGGMAQVYRAFDTVLGRTVAVKIIQPGLSLDGDEFSERFLREARLVASLEHPHLLPVYDFGEQDGRPYLVMPCVEGGTLSEQMAAGAVEPERVTRWIAELGAALDAAHTAGVLHRDVKPSNILLTADDRAILADFGISRMSESSTRLTMTGQVVGTPVYMAPELVLGEPASPASDLYALAVLAYELLAGTPPYRGDNPLAVLHQHAREPIPPLSSHAEDLPETVDAFFAQALAKAPEHRPSTGAALADRLSIALTGSIPVPDEGFDEEPAPLDAGLPTASASADDSNRTEDATLTRKLPSASQDQSLGLENRFSDDEKRSGLGRFLAVAGLLLVVALVAVFAIRSLNRNRGEEGPQVQQAAIIPNDHGDPPDDIETHSESEPSDVESAAGESGHRGESIERPAETDAETEAETGLGNEEEVPETLGESPTDPSTDGASEPSPAMSSRGADVTHLARMIEAVRRFAPMSEERFELLSNQLSDSSRDRSNDMRLATLRNWARGGLAFSRGDENVAGSSASQLLSSPQARMLLVIPAMTSVVGQRDGQQDGQISVPAWAQAVIYRDPRGNGQRLVDAELSRRPDEPQLRFARALLHGLHGDRAAALEGAASVFATLPATETEARSTVAYFAGQQLVAAERWPEALEWFRRSFESGGPIGPLAAFEAARIATRSGETQVAATLFQKACDAGLRAACREAERPRPARPFRRPN